MWIYRLQNKTETKRRRREPGYARASALAFLHNHLRRSLPIHHSEEQGLGSETVSERTAATESEAGCGFRSARRWGSARPSGAPSRFPSASGRAASCTRASMVRGWQRPQPMVGELHSHCAAADVAQFNIDTAPTHSAPASRPRAPTRTSSSTRPATPPIALAASRTRGTSTPRPSGLSAAHPPHARPPQRRRRRQRPRRPAGA